MRLQLKVKVARVIPLPFIYLILCSFFVFSQDNTTLETNTTPDSNVYNQTNITQEDTNTTDGTPINTSQEVINETKEKKEQEDPLIQETQNQNNDGKPSDTTIVETPVVTQSFESQIYLEENSYDFISYAGSLLFKVNPLEEFTFYYRDYLGSVRGTFSEFGDVFSNKNYLIFGEQINNNGDYSGKAYTTKEQDSESDLYYFGARYYDDDLGRFVSVDPKYNPLETPYSYARNNPLAFVDPDGKEVMLAKFIGHEDIEYLYRSIGGEIPQVKSIINDNKIHAFLPRYTSKETNQDYLKVIPKGREIDALTLSATMSLIDVDKINSYNYGEPGMILLHHLLHEAIHQYDVSKADNEKRMLPRTTTLSQEIAIENTIIKSLNLNIPYELAIKDPNSWVTRYKVSKDQYSNLFMVADKSKRRYEETLRRQQERERKHQEKTKIDSIFSPEDEERIRNYEE